MNHHLDAVDIVTLKQKQIDHHQAAFEGVSDPAYENNIFHDYFRAIPFARTAALLDRLGVDLNGKTVLVTSCGNGIDVHYLRKYYPNATFTVCDLSESAVTIATSALRVDGTVEDSEKLSCSDQQFDYAFVAASLHHLPRPWLGLYEMIRVSRYGAIVIEPNDSLLTRIATGLGLATEVESSGNYVFRIAKGEVEKISKSLFYGCVASQYFAVHRVAKNRLEFLLLKIFNHLANIVAPSQGNYISFVIFRNANQQPLSVQARG